MHTILITVKDKCTEATSFYAQQLPYNPLFYRIFIFLNGFLSTIHWGDHIKTGETYVKQSVVFRGQSITERVFKKISESTDA